MYKCTPVELYMNEVYMNGHKWMNIDAMDAKVKMKMWKWMKFVLSLNKSETIFIHLCEILHFNNILNIKSNLGLF